MINHNAKNDMYFNCEKKDSGYPAAFIYETGLTDEKLCCFINDQI